MSQKLQNNNRGFFVIIIILQAILLVIYRFFFQVTRYVESNSNQYNSNNVLFYPMQQDVNVMMLIGFGFLMTFIKSGSWSALSYTFFTNAIIVQYYLVLSGFWKKIFQGQWHQNTIYFRQQNFTAASYSVASVLIALGAVLGRVGPYQILIMGVIQIIAYTLNEYICYQLIHIYDVGGSTVIHTFGAYFGLACSRILSIKKKPNQDIKIQSNQTSITFAMIGTMFLWIFWPSFNAGFFPQNGQIKTIIIQNTILALTGSCLGAFIISSFCRQKLEMEDLLNASLAGGVIIGAPSSIFINPAASIICGLGAGIISTLGFIYLSLFLKKKIGLLDTCGVNNLHGIPGILGGILSSIAISSYQSITLDPILGNQLNYYSSTFISRSYSLQAWFQLVGLICSLGIGSIAGCIAGYLMHYMYNLRNHHFYRDSPFFQVPLQELQKQPVQRSMVIDYMK